MPRRHAASIGQVIRIVVLALAAAVAALALIRPVAAQTPALQGDCGGPGPLGTVGGHKVNDIDGDGQRGSGEGTLPGWTIELRLGATLIATTTTDASGAYRFTGLPPGDYLVCEVPQSGWLATGPTCVPAAIPAGGSYFACGRDFYNRRPTGSLSGIKYADSDGSGTISSGDAPLPGWTIELTLPDGSTLSTTTDASGAYSFAGLAAGTYVVCEVMSPQQVAEGWVRLIPGGCYTVSLPTDGQCQLCSRDFLNRPPEVPATGSIAGKKYEDLSGDGPSGDDLPLAGWTIRLYRDVNADGSLDSGDTLVGTAVTGADGGFSFTDLPLGHYLLTEELVPGWGQTFPATPALAVEVTAGTPHRSGCDFYNHMPPKEQPKGSISGAKYRDLTGNGPSADDLPLAGWTIRLYRDADGNGIVSDGDEVRATAVTDPDGRFSFADLELGAYVVVEELQPGWTQTGPDGGVHPIVIADEPGHLVLDGVDFHNFLPEEVTPTATGTNTSTPAATETSLPAPTLTATAETPTVAPTTPAATPATPKVATATQTPTPPGLATATATVPPGATATATLPAGVTPTAPAGPTATPVAPAATETATPGPVPSGSPVAPAPTTPAVVTQTPVSPEASALPGPTVAVTATSQAAMPVTGGVHVNTAGVGAMAAGGMLVLSGFSLLSRLLWREWRRS